MKNFIIILGIILISFSSCQITERVYINEDGSGTFDFEINMNEMMKSMAEMGGEKLDSTAVAKDSIIYFSDLLKDKKDSIAKLPKEERAQIEMLKDMTVKIHEDKSKSEMIINYLIKFKDVNDLAKAQNMLSNANKMNKGDNGLPSKTDLQFSFKKNKFLRKSIAKKLNEEEKTEYDSSMNKFNMFLEGSAYNLEYHFPKPIKSTTVKNATFSDDRKILYIKSTIDAFIEDAKVLDFEVILVK